MKSLSTTELEKWETDRVLATEEEKHSDIFPVLSNISPAFFFRFLPVPQHSQSSPEFVQVRTSEDLGLSRDSKAERDVFIASWNNTWEAQTERSPLFQEDAPKDLEWLRDTNTDVRLIPEVSSLSSYYDAYTPLYHLLPASTLDHFQLPALKGAFWPYMLPQLYGHPQFLPNDLRERLENAFSYHVWGLLGIRGVPSAFSAEEPIRVLTHNLDFWLPYVDMVAQRRIRMLGRVPFDDDKQRSDHERTKSKMPPGVSLERPLHGGYVWCGEGEAAEVTREMIEVADTSGNLQAILDAVRSHRVEEDFSERWSYEREDFERKLYCKRNKIQVHFVEIHDTIPVHGPLSEVHEDLLWEDFFSLLNWKDRQVVVCLRNGITKVGEIATELGYANHSPVSKRLKKIREKASRFFDLT